MQERERGGGEQKQIDTERGRQTDRQTDRKRKTHTGRQTDRQTETDPCTTCGSRSKPRQPNLVAFPHS